MGSSDGGSKRNGNHFQDQSTVLYCTNVLVLFLLKILISNQFLKVLHFSYINGLTLYVNCAVF